MSKDPLSEDYDDPPAAEAGEGAPNEWDRLGESASMRALLPVGRSFWAILAGYLGLFSILVLPAPFAIVAGILAVLDIRRHPERHGMVRAIFGILMGAGGTFFLVLWAIS